MESEDVVARIEKVVGPILQSWQVEMVELIFHAQGGTWLVRLLVDKPHGGITLGECARLNKEIGGILDRLNVIEHRYILEVASPGLERPLKTERDFRRAQGELVKIAAKLPLTGTVDEKIPVNVVGTLLEVREAMVILEEEGSKRWEIPFDCIIKGAREIRF